MNSQSNRKTLYALFSIIFATLACSASPPVAPNPANPTGIPNQPTAPTAVPNQLPRILPTAIAGQEVAVATSETDTQGKAEFHDPLIQRRIAVKVEDSASNQPLNNISVSFVSNGPRLLVFAVDPSRRYMPLVKEVSYDKVGLSKQMGYAKPAAASESAIVVTILLMKVLDIHQTSRDWIAIFQDPPDLERWGFFSQDYCANSDQMSTGLRALTGTALLILPGPKHLMGKIPASDELQDWSWLAAIAEMTGSIAGDKIKDNLSKLVSSRSGIVRLRIYSINGLTFGAPAVPIGWCLEPLNRKDKASVLQWVRYGFERKELYVFKKLVPEWVLYGMFGTDRGIVVEREELLLYIDRRLSSQPKCNAYSTDDSGMTVWSSGWQPLWQLRGFIDYNGRLNEISPPHQSDEIAFAFDDRGSGSGELYLSSVGLDAGSRDSRFLQVHAAIPCP